MSQDETKEQAEAKARFIRWQGEQQTKRSQSYGNFRWAKVFHTAYGNP